MKRISSLILCLAAAMVAATPAPAQSKYQITPPNPFILFIFAPNADSKPANAEYDMLQKGAQEIDRSGIETVYVVGDSRVKLPPPDAKTEDSAALRKRYHIDLDAFRLVLVAPNGSEKIRWSEPVDAHQVALHANEMPRPKSESTTQ